MNSKLKRGIIIGATAAATPLVANAVVKTIAMTGGSMKAFGFLVVGAVVAPVVRMAKFVGQPFAASLS